MRKRKSQTQGRRTPEKQSSKAKDLKEALEVVETAGRIKSSWGTASAVLRRIADFRQAVVVYAHTKIPEHMLKAEANHEHEVNGETHRVFKEAYLKPCCGRDLNGEMSATDLVQCLWGHISDNPIDTVTKYSQIAPLFEVLKTVTSTYGDYPDNFSAYQQYVVAIADKFELFRMILDPSIVMMFSPPTNAASPMASAASCAIFNNLPVAAPVGGIIPVEEQHRATLTQTNVQITFDADSPVTGAYSFFDLDEAGMAMFAVGAWSQATANSVCLMRFDVDPAHTLHKMNSVGAGNVNPPTEAFRAAHAAASPLAGAKHFLLVRNFGGGLPCIALQNMVSRLTGPPAARSVMLGNHGVPITGLYTYDTSEDARIAQVALCNIAREGGFSVRTIILSSTVAGIHWKNF